MQQSWGLRWPSSLISAKLHHRPRTSQKFAVCSLHLRQLALLFLCLLYSLLLNLTSKMATAVAQGAAGNNSFKVGLIKISVCGLAAKHHAGQGEAHGGATIEHSCCSRCV